VSDDLAKRLADIDAAGQKEFAEGDNWNSCSKALVRAVKAYGGLPEPTLRAIAARDDATSNLQLVGREALLKEMELYSSRDDNQRQRADTSEQEYSRIRAAERKRFNELKGRVT
jgi:hypothetical protein